MKEDEGRNFLQIKRKKTSNEHVPEDRVGSIQWTKKIQQKDSLSKMKKNKAKRTKRRTRERERERYSKTNDHK